MTAPMSPSPARVGDDRAGGATTFDEDMRAWLASGAALLDNVTDPDVIGSYGLEATTCWLCEGVGHVDDGDRLCPQCLGGGVA